MSIEHLLNSSSFHEIHSAPDTPVLSTTEGISPIAQLSPLSHSTSLLLENLSNLELEESQYDIVDGSINRCPELGPKLVVIMVGLPARGKSYICKKLKRYLSWLGYSTCVFNVGNRRRNRSNARDPFHAISDVNATNDKRGTSHFSDFFDPKNCEASRFRDQLAMDTLDELIAWLHQGKGKVAIHDATNTTRARRDQIMAKLKLHTSFEVLFLESVCDSPAILEANVRMKLDGPDYRGMAPEVALSDFKERIANYEQAYEPLGAYEDAQGLSYVTVINVGKKIVSSNIHGYLPSQIVFYLMNTHIGERTIWITRHGESCANVENKIGGDPPLTALGNQYAEALARFFTAKYADSSKPIPVWTSALRRTRESASYFPSSLFVKGRSHLLNEIHAGLFNEMTLQEVQQTYPNEFFRRQANKLYYRYPGVSGESYLDVITRLKPIIIETERLREDLIIISHQVVSRIILAYYLGVPLKSVPTLSTPLHTLYALRPNPYGADLVTYKFNPTTDSFEKSEVNDLFPPDM